MDKQAREAREMVKKLPFKERMKHFWEYYRLHTIAAVVVAVLIGITIYQSVTRVKYDLELTYYGSGITLTQEQTDLLEEYLSEYIEDIDNNGDKNVNIVYVNSSLGGESMEYRMAINQKLMAELASGDYSGYIFDTYYYDYAGPDSEVGAFETSFNMCDNAELKELLGLGDDPVYWCTKLLYEREADDEKTVARHNNALLAEKAIRGEQ